MKTKQTLRKLAEPFAYVILVAAFGFITSVVNQAERDEKSGDPDFVTLNLKDGNEISLIESSGRFETGFLKKQTEIEL